MDAQMWMNFFEEAGLEHTYAVSYGSIFSENQMKLQYLPHLSAEYLRQMNIKCMGHVIAILNHAKVVGERNEQPAITSPVKSGTPTKQVHSSQCNQSIEGNNLVAHSNGNIVTVRNVSPLQHGGNQKLLSESAFGLIKQSPISFSTPNYTQICSNVKMGLSEKFKSRLPQWAVSGKCDERKCDENELSDHDTDLTVIVYNEPNLVSQDDNATSFFADSIPETLRVADEDSISQESVALEKHDGYSDRTFTKCMGTQIPEFSGQKRSPQKLPVFCRLGKRLMKCDKEITGSEDLRLILGQKRKGFEEMDHRSSVVGCKRERNSPGIKLNRSLCNRLSPLRSDLSEENNNSSRRIPPLINNKKFICVPEKDNYHQKKVTFGPADIKNVPNHDLKGRYSYTPERHHKSLLECPIRSYQEERQSQLEQSKLTRLRRSSLNVEPLKRKNGILGKESDSPVRHHNSPLEEQTTPSRTLSSFQEERESRLEQSDISATRRNSINPELQKRKNNMLGKDPYSHPKDHNSPQEKHTLSSCQIERDSQLEQVSAPRRNSINLELQNTKNNTLGRGVSNGSGSKSKDTSGALPLADLNNKVILENNCVRHSSDFYMAWVKRIKSVNSFPGSQPHFPQMDTSSV